MTYAVSIAGNQDSVHWDSITRWVEAVAGPPGERWCLSNDDEASIYIFKHRAHAEHFKRVWSFTPLILGYEVWEEFCNSRLSRARVDDYWRHRKWLPKVVLFFDRPKAVSSTFGGQRHFSMRHKCWFFENYTDAWLFWIEHYEGK
jgi:hypothetical protein